MLCRGIVEGKQTSHTDAAHPVAIAADIFIDSSHCSLVLLYLPTFTQQESNQNLDFDQRPQSKQSSQAVTADISIDSFHC